MGFLQKLKQNSNVMEVNHDTITKRTSNGGSAI